MEVKVGEKGIGEGVRSKKKKSERRDAGRGKKGE